MGNKLTCCHLKQPGTHRSGRNRSTGNGINAADRYRIGGRDGDIEDSRLLHGSGNLQHISEREPDDIEGDPSNNPTKESIFLIRSKSEIEKSHQNRRRSFYDKHYLRHVSHQGIRRYSSCATILLDDSTVSQPNLKNMIRALALAIYVNIRNRSRLHDDSLGVSQSGPLYEELEIFDEAKHPLHREPLGEDFARRDPDQRQIYRFVRTLFSAAQLTAECAVVTLVYLERLVTYAELELCPRNWRRCVLGAILLASKVWDDQAVWNVDYCQILRETKVEDMNELERQYLELVQFNINVPSSVYAKYYFDLRSLLNSHDMSHGPRPLSKERAHKLEAMQRVLDDPFRDMVTPRSRKRTFSLDGLTAIPQFNRAVLS